MKPEESLTALPVFSDDACTYPITERIKYTIDYLGFRGCHPEHFSGDVANLWAAEQWANGMSQNPEAAREEIEKNESLRDAVTAGFKLVGVDVLPSDGAESHMDTMLGAIAKCTEGLSIEDFEKRCAELVLSVDERHGILLEGDKEMVERDSFEAKFLSRIREYLKPEGLTYLSAYEVFEAGGGEQIIIHAVCVERNEFIVVTPSGEIGLYRTGATTQVPETLLSEIAAHEKSAEGFELVRGFRMPSTFLDWVTGYDELAMAMQPR